MLTVGCTATSLGRADGIRTGEHLTGHPVLCSQLGTLRAEKTYTIGMSLTQASSSHQPGAQGRAMSAGFGFRTKGIMREGAGERSDRRARAERDPLIIVVFIPGRIEATAEGKTKDIKF